MPITSVASLVCLLRELPLLGPAALRELGDAPARFADAAALARHLVRRGWLSPYQANQLILGNGPDLLLGHYVLLERLGEGGMGQVFKARHRHLDRLDAIKVIRPGLLADPAAVERFRREARSAARLNHPHIVRVYDAGADASRHFLAMEYVPGTDLAAVVRRDGPLPPGRVCQVLYQVALALQHAHEQGLVHRDIKPSNLLLAAEVVKVLDLGLVRPCPGEDGAAGEPVTAAGTLLGTPDYMAPEQTRDAGAVDIRADLYALGCTGYHLLVGHVPFPGGDAVEKLLRHRQEEPPAADRLRRDVPPACAAVVYKLMAKDPARRYQTPAELAVALRPLLQLAPEGLVATGDGTVLAPPHPAAVRLPPLPAAEAAEVPPTRLDTAPTPALPPVKPGRPAWAALSGGLALVGVVGLCLFVPLVRWLWQSRPPPRIDEAPAVTAGWKHERSLQVCGGPLVAVAFIPHTDLLAVGAGDTPGKAGPYEVFIWDPAGGKRYPVGLHTDGPVRCLAVAGDRRRMATGSGHPFPSRPVGGDIRLWNVEAPEHKRPDRLLKERPKAHPGGVGGLTFFNADKTLVSAGGSWTGDRSVKKWSKAWVLLEPWRDSLGSHALGVTALALAPDRPAVATGSADGVAKLLDLGRPREILKLPHQQPVCAVAFSPDGKTLAVAAARIEEAPGPPGQIGLYDVEIGQPRPVRLPLDDDSRVWSLAFHPDPKSRLLAGGCSDGKVRVWDATTGQPGGSFDAHRGGVTAIAFSRDGTWLATGGREGDVKAWRRERFTVR